MTDLENALKEALDRKQNDINNFVWKNKLGKNVRMMDLTSDELKDCYDHCTDMLWNKSTFNPGKLQIKKNIKNTIDNCNAQLFLRYLFLEVKLEAIKSNKDLLDFINNSKQAYSIKDTDCITSLFSNLPIEFEDITVDKLLMACFDKLDVLNRKMISDKFILSQGIWLTESEKKDLTEFDETGKMRNRMDVIKERLILNNDIRLRIDPNGLSYNEFRSLVLLDSSPKISSLTTATLKLLRDKILLLLENDLNYHIDKWNNLKEQIERVAEYKNIKLVSKIY